LKVSTVRQDLTEVSDAWISNEDGKFYGFVSVPVLGIDEARGAVMKQKSQRTFHYKSKSLTANGAIPQRLCITMHVPVCHRPYVRTCIVSRLAANEHSLLYGN